LWHNDRQPRGDGVRVRRVKLLADALEDWHRLKHKRITNCNFMQQNKNVTSFLSGLVSLSMANHYMNLGMFPFLLNQWINLESSDNGQQYSVLLTFWTLSIIQYSKPENVLEAESASIFK
jgi:hypothetical protein